MVMLEIELENRYIVLRCEAEGNSNIFKLRKFNSEDSEYTVMHSSVDNHLECAFLLFQSDSIPCRHIFLVMKNMDLQNIPESLFKRRFMKKAK